MATDPLRYDLTRDVGNYVDFSTPPLTLIPGFSAFVVVDVSNAVQKYLQMNEMISFYQRFPVHEIVGVLLSTSLRQSGVPGHWDTIAFILEEKFGEQTTHLDIDHLFLLFESMATDFESEIVRKCPHYAESQDYVFYDWVDPYSICFCLEHTGLQRSPHELSYRR